MTTRVFSYPFPVYADVEYTGIFANSGAFERFRSAMKKIWKGHNWQPPQTGKNIVRMCIDNSSRTRKHVIVAR